MSRPRTLAAVEKNHFIRISFQPQQSPGALWEGVCGVGGMVVKYSRFFMLVYMTSLSNREFSSASLIGDMRLSNSGVRHCRCAEFGVVWTVGMMVRLLEHLDCGRDGAPVRAPGLWELWGCWSHIFSSGKELRGGCGGAVIALPRHLIGRRRQQRKVWPIHRPGEASPVFRIFFSNDIAFSD